MSTPPAHGHAELDADAVGRRIEALALAIAEAPVSATISSRTYAPREVATLDTMAAPEHSAAPTRRVLPRVTIQYLDDNGAAPMASADDGPDLTALSLLGEGGMGRVFAAEQRSIGRVVAVKTLRESLFDVASSSLIAEARIAGSLEHPHIVPIHALGIDSDGRPLIVMKRVQGVSWAVLLRDHAHPAWTALLARTDGDRLAAHLDVFSAVCDALDFAHAAGVLHRDVKPDNVLVGSWGETYLTDWGVAARFEDLANEAPAQVVGTPAYMAPEMVARELGPPDPRTDVYLLGATLFEVLTGRTPHEQPTMMATMFHAFASAAPSFDADVPAELGALCARAMARRLDDRPRSAGDFRKALLDFLKHRAASRLTEEASVRLAELRSAIARSTSDPAIAGLATECRFAFQLALREWSQNEPARNGLDACVAALIERELARKGVDAARTLLSGLLAARPDLEARVAELERQQAVELERTARNEHLLREHDLSVTRGVRARSSAANSLVVVSAAVSEAWFVRSVAGRVLVAAVTSAVIIAIVLLTSRHIRRAGKSTQIGRRVAMTVMIGAAVIVANRSFCWLSAASLAQLCISDLTLLAAFYLVSAACIEPKLYPAGGVALLGAVVAAASSSHATWTFAAAFSVATVVASIGWSGRDAAAETATAATTS